MGMFESESIIGKRQLFCARDVSGCGIGVAVGVAIFGSKSGRHMCHVIRRE